MITRILAALALVLITFNFASAQQDEFAQANTHYKAFLFKEAIPLYEVALSKDAYLSEAMLYLAFCYYYTNNSEKAEQWFERVTRFDEYKQYKFEYGLTLKMNGKYNKAKEIFAEVATLDYQKGTHYSKSCDFALGSNPLDKSFKVINLQGVNSKSADFAPTFYNKQVIFSSSRSVALERNGEVAWTNDAFNQHYKINDKGSSQEAQPLRSYIGNDINDAPMSYFPRQYYAAITSNNFMDGIRHIDGSGLMMDIYLYKIKSEKEWDRSSEQFFTFNANINSKAPYSTGHPCLVSEGTTMYFASNRPGGFGGYDIYVSHRTANGWTAPQNLGHPVNTAGNEMSPFVDNNGNLYFSSDWHAGYGGMDVFMSNRMTYGWGPIQNLGNQVNSTHDDMYFIFDSDFKIGYLASNRNGSLGNEDIYKVEQVESVVVQTKLKMNIGDKYIFDDIYFSPGDESLQNRNSQGLLYLVQRLLDNPDVAIQINGFTDVKGSDVDNLELSKKRAKSLRDFLVARGINSNRILHEGYGENFLVNGCKDDVPCTRDQHAENRRLEVQAIGKIGNDGGINIIIDPLPAPNANEIVAAEIKKDVTSNPVKSTNTSSRTTSSSSSKKPVRLDHYAIGDLIEVANIYYEHNSSKIDEKNSPGLAQLLDVLKEHPNVVIEIGAHTDATGSDSYNKQLSEKRADAVKTYLEKKGIPASRLFAKGYGEAKPLNKCKDGVKCSDEEHALNRRTEFTVIAQKGFKIGDVIKVDHINYELDKEKLDMKNSRGLQEIIQILKDNEISVEIRSHTDSRGSSKYNLELSEKRAKSVYDYLVKNGVNKYRLKYKGYGETKLLNKCKDGVRCSNSEHSENRRTDFKVIGLR